jgi:CO/xanthine dehydrogenase Mo-binding subunit
LGGRSFSCGLRRIVGVFAAGRIINAKTARSQLMGG